MSTSLLYHGFGVRGYRYLKTEHTAGSMIFHLEQPRETCRCSACGSADVVFRGAVERRIRTLPLGRKPVWLAVSIPRVACRTCRVVRQVTIGLAETRLSYSKPFARYALELSRHMDKKRCQEPFFLTRAPSLL